MQERHYDLRRIGQIVISAKLWTAGASVEIMMPSYEPSEQLGTVQYLGTKYLVKTILLV